MDKFLGSILEFNGNKAIVMTDKCDFITIKKKPEMFIGQQLRIEKPLSLKSNNYLKYLAIAGMFVLVLCSVIFFQISKPVPVFAYVDVDINPSLELMIDKKANVIDVETLNNDAKTLVQDLKLVDVPLKNAVGTIIEESHNKGFIKNDKENAVVISASIEPDRHNTGNASREKVLDDIVSELLKTDFSVGSLSIKPQLIRVSPEKRTEALKNDISMGRYTLFEEMSGNNNDIDIEEAKTENLSNMLNAVNAHKQQKAGQDKVSSDLQENKDTETFDDDEKSSEKPKEDSDNKEKPKLDEKHNEDKSGSEDDNIPKNDNVKKNKKNVQKSFTGEDDKKDDVKDSSDESKDGNYDNKPQNDEDSGDSSDKKETFDQSSSSDLNKQDKPEKSEKENSDDEHDRGKESHDDNSPGGKSNGHK